MTDEDTRPRLPLAIYLEDSKFSVNVTELCWVNEPQVMTGVSTLHIIQSPKLSLKAILLYEEEEKSIESETRKRWPTQHSTITAGTYGSTWSTSHSLTYFVLITDWGGDTVICLVRQRKSRYIETELSPLLFLTILHCLPGENYSLMAKLSKSLQSIYISYNSQSPTISQKVLQGQSHFLKDVLHFPQKISPVRHLLIKFMFPYRNLSSVKQTLILLFSELCD